MKSRALTILRKNQHSYETLLSKICSVLLTMQKMILLRDINRATVAHFQFIKVFGFQTLLFKVKHFYASNVSLTYLSGAFCFYIKEYFGVISYPGSHIVLILARHILSSLCQEICAFVMVTSDTIHLERVTANLIND